MLDAEQKGERAAQILENEVYLEAVTGAKQRIKDGWTKASSAVEREALWHQFQAIQAVTTELLIIRDRGIMERKKNEKELPSA